MPPKPAMHDMKDMHMPSAGAKKDTMQMNHAMPGMPAGPMQVGKDTMPAGRHEMMNMDHANPSGMGDTTRKKMNDAAKPPMAGHMQMDHSMHNMQDTMPVDHGNMKMADQVDMGGMSHAYSLNLPMNRNGSGTGWLPDPSPMYGYMFHKNNWMYMLHGNLFLRYNSQDFTNKGSRGAAKFDAPDWLMFMGQKKMGQTGLFHFSTMFSLDAVTGGNGYPLLFQSGEAYKGAPIVDRQHPHDLFSELSASYAQALSKNTDVFLYIGYPGEPALGPVAFMHRPSALDNPDAPLSHHWVDATHITFGVATLGLRLGDLKVEGSSFTGKEPDDNRYNFDKPLFDSWSGRLSYNPSQNWALQVSHGFIKSPESLHPGEDIHRTTASAIFSRGLAANSTFNTTLVWGLNKTQGPAGEHAVLLETQWRKNKLALHSRYEWVQKSTEELDLDETVYGHVVFPVNAFTLGFNYDLFQPGQTRLAVGSQLTFYHAPEKLNGLYGKDPMAVEVYLRLYPSLMSMKMKH
ncbi:MAG: hypothetical protein JWQ78_1591 [Sediminibacterium sp.]|nr:hypothetical protein [Sediminibacterium sp.]